LTGSCLGFEAICRVQSNDITILSGFDAENVSWPLDFTTMASQSRMFASTNPLSEIIMGYLANNNITLNNHVAGMKLKACVRCHIFVVVPS